MKTSSGFFCFTKQTAQACDTSYNSWGIVSKTV